MTVAVSLCISLAAWTGTGHGAQGDSNAVSLAVVNGDTITSADLDHLLIKSHRSMNPDDRSSFDYERLLTRLVNDRLLVQEAQMLGIHEDRHLMGKLTDTRNLRAARLWVMENFKPDLSVSEEAIQEFYEDKFRSAQFRLISVRTEDTAKILYDAIRAGASMDSLAREYSIDHYMSRGGLRKPTTLLELEPVLLPFAESMDVGVISEPFPYRSVYGLTRLEQSSLADTAQYHMVRGKIESWFKDEERLKQWALFVKDLENRYPVVDVPAALDAIQADSGMLFTPEFAIGSDNPVIHIGEVRFISDEEFRGELGHSAMEAGTTPFGTLFREARERLVERHLLMAAAFADGFDQTPELVDRFNRSLDSALVEIYLQETVVPRIVFRHDEFEVYYQEHGDDFMSPELLQFDRLMTDSESVAIEVYNRLVEGGELRFVAGQYGVEVAPMEESSEWLEITTFPESIRREIGTLRVGEYITPRQTEEGWLILRLLTRQPGAMRPMDEVEPQIRQAMFQIKFEEELDSVLSILRENSDIEYDEEAIQEYFGDDS